MDSNKKGRNLIQKLPRPTATATVQIDNEVVRLTEYYFLPEAETKFHKHKWDYIVTPMTDGDLMLVDSLGVETFATLTQGKSYYREAGVEHNVINVGKLDLVFIEIEIKK